MVQHAAANRTDVRVPTRRGRNGGIIRHFMDGIGGWSPPPLLSPAAAAFPGRPDRACPARERAVRSLRGCATAPPPAGTAAASRAAPAEVSGLEIGRAEGRGRL